MANKKFSKGEAIKFGWDTFKKNIGFLIVVMIIGISPSLLQALVSNVVKPVDSVTTIIYSINSIGLSVLGMVLTMGVIKISIGLCDKKKNEISDIFSCYHLFFKELGATFFYTLPFILLGIAALLLVGVVKMGHSNSNLLFFQSALLSIVLYQVAL